MSLAPHVPTLPFMRYVLGVVEFIAQPKPDPNCIALQEKWGYENGRIVSKPDICIAWAETPQP